MTIPADVIDLARSVDILEAAKQLSARIKKVRAEWIGPCLSCGGRDRFAINTRKQVFNCRGCGAKGDVIALVQLALGVGFREAVEELAGATETRARSKPRAPGPAPAGEEKDAARNSGLALAIFDRARSVRGTIAEQYLAEIRGVDLDQLLELEDVLRFDPACPFGGRVLPCLVALVRNILTDAPQAIQRTARSATGDKIERMSLGPTKGGAIKLWPDSEVTTGLVVGEGMETTAAAATRVTHRGTLLAPGWSLIDAAGLAGFPVLGGVEALTILTDNDAAGLDAADECERRCSRPGAKWFGFYRRGSGATLPTSLRERAHDACRLLRPIRRDSKTRQRRSSMHPHLALKGLRLPMHTDRR
jgi:hypothetical protein